MRRVVPTILAVLAVVGLLVPPSRIVHAHEDGHEDHAHGPGNAIHIALSDVDGIDAIGHAHPHEDASHDAPVPAPDDGPDEDHVHLGSAADAVTRVRESTVDAGGADGAPVLLPTVLGAWTRVMARTTLERAIAAPDPRPVSSRVLDALVALGRLLI